MHTIKARGATLIALAMARVKISKTICVSRNYSRLQNLPCCIHKCVCWTV